MLTSVPNLSVTQKSLLVNYQRISTVRNESSLNLSSGQRDNSPQEDPVDYASAQVLADKVSSLLETKGEISLDLSALDATSVSLDSIGQLSQQLKGIAMAAKSSTNPAEKAALAEQFNNIRTQIDNIVSNSTFLGENLLSSSGIDVSSSGLGIGDADEDYNGFASDGDIDAALTAVDNAIVTVRQTVSDLSGSIAALQVRESYTEELSDTLQEGVDKLVNADMSVEAARQMSAQVKSNLSISGQQMLAQADSMVLELFSNS